MLWSPSLFFAGAITMTRELTPKEVRRLEIGKRIWDRWKIKFGVDSVLIIGGKK
jgi:hypothetical protein